MSVRIGLDCKVGEVEKKWWVAPVSSITLLIECWDGTKVLFNLKGILLVLPTIQERRLDKVNSEPPLRL